MPRCKTKFECRTIYFILLNAFQYDWFTFFKTCGLQEEHCNEYKEKFIEHRLCHILVF